MKLTWEVSIPIELNRDRQVVVGNQRIWATLGPQDVPREVIVFRQQRRLKLEFHYYALPEEPDSTIECGPLRITRGTQSGRVMYILCEVDVGLDEIGHALDLLKTDALSLDPSYRPQRRSTHYELIAEDILPYVIEQVQQELMDESR